MPNKRTNEQFNDVLFCEFVYLNVHVEGKKKIENDLFKPMLRYWFPLNRVSCFVSEPSLKSVNFPQFDFPSRGQSTFRATHAPLLNLQQYFLAPKGNIVNEHAEKRIYWFNKSIACTLLKKLRVLCLSLQELHLVNLIFCAVKLNKNEGSYAQIKFS